MGFSSLALSSQKASFFLQWDVIKDCFKGTTVNEKKQSTTVNEKNQSTMVNELNSFSISLLWCTYLGIAYLPCILQGSC